MIFIGTLPVTHSAATCRLPSCCPQTMLLARPTYIRTSVVSGAHTPSAHSTASYRKKLQRLLGMHSWQATHSAMASGLVGLLPSSGDSTYPPKIQLVLLRQSCQLLQGQHPGRPWVCRHPEAGLMVPWWRGFSKGPQNPRVFLRRRDETGALSWMWGGDGGLWHRACPAFFGGGHPVSSFSGVSKAALSSRPVPDFHLLLLAKPTGPMIGQLTLGNCRTHPHPPPVTQDGGHTAEQCWSVSPQIVACPATWPAPEQCCGWSAADTGSAQCMIMLRSVRWARPRTLLHQG